jgi:hypothetical protein
MTVDWRLSQLQREAQAKREQLDNLNTYIVRLDAMLAEANSFEGHFNERLAEANRRAFEVAPRVDVNVGMAFSFPYHVHPDHHDEHERRQARIREIEHEREEERARRTTTSHDGAGFTLSFCELDPGDISRKRSRLVMTRDAIARELAEIEAQLTPGQLVESGMPADEYVEHRQRVAALRERIGAAS